MAYRPTSGLIGGAVVFGAAAVATDLLSPRGTPYSPQNPNYKGTLLNRMVDGNEMALMRRQAAGMENDISRAEGIPLAAVMANDGVNMHGMNNATGTLDRLKRDLGANQVKQRSPNPSPGFKPTFEA